MGCGCLLSPVSSFYWWVKDNGTKGIIVAGAVILVLIIGIYAVSTAVIDSMNPYNPTLEEQAGFLPPPRKDAPYKVTTQTRIYYAMIAIDNGDSSVTMTNYYEWLGGEWTLHTGVFVLDKNYGDIEVKKRPYGD